MVQIDEGSGKGLNGVHHDKTHGCKKSLVLSMASVVVDICASRTHTWHHGNYHPQYIDSLPV